MGLSEHEQGEDEQADTRDGASGSSGLGAALLDPVLLAEADTQAPEDQIDVLIFQHTHGRSHLLLGGLGRGEEWAGTVAVEERDEPRLVAASDGLVVRVAADDPVRIVGPYYATTAALVGLGDIVGVVGGAAGVAATLDDEALTRVVRSAASTLADAEPRRDLVTELAAYRKLQHLLLPDTSVATTAQGLAHATAELLDADFVMVLPEPGGPVSTVHRAWAPASPAALRDVAALIVGALPEETLVIQDCTDAPLPHPLSPEDGLISAMVMPLQSGGFIQAIHTTAEARGFTSLDTDLGTMLSEVGSIALAGASTATTLARHIERVRWLVRRDVVTGLPDDGAWDEALSATTSGAIICVGVVDPAPTDRFLQVVAAVLQRQAQDTDLVARVSPTEFAMLLRGAGDATAEALASTIHQRLGPVDADGERRVRLGWAASPDLPDVRTAWRVAAGRMLSD